MHTLGYSQLLVSDSSKLRCDILLGLAVITPVAHPSRPIKSIEIHYPLRPSKIRIDLTVTHKVKLSRVC